MSLRQPIYRSVTDEVALSIIGEHLFTQTFIFYGTPDSDLRHFPGFQNGAATVSALRFAQDWTHRTIDTVLASTLTIQRRPERAWARPSMRIPIRRTDNSSPGWARLRRFKQFGEKLLGMQLLGRMDLQLTNSPLFPLEQVALGGRYTVRGYREVTIAAR